MTVQELINALLKIEDKSQLVYLPYTSFDEKEHLPIDGIELRNDRLTIW